MILFIVPPAMTPPRESRLVEYAALAAAVTAVSFAAPLVRLAASGPLQIAFWRVALAAAGAWFLDALRSRGAARPRSSRGAIIAGVLLGLHFGVWIASLGHTSVANSVLFVTTQPIWAAIGGVLFLRERIPWLGWLGVILALVASALTAGGGGIHVRGDLMALAGGILAAAYMVIGRRERQSWETVPYVARVYTAAAATLAIWILAAGESFLPARPSDWWVFAALAAIPTGVGHSLYNRLLRRLPAHVVATGTMGEPIGASILAFLWLHESPPARTLLFAPLLLAGIALVALSRPRPARPPTP